MQQSWAFSSTAFLHHLCDDAFSTSVDSSQRTPKGRCGAVALLKGCTGATVIVFSEDGHRRLRSGQVQDISEMPSLTVAGPKSILSVECLVLGRLHRCALR